MHLYFLLAKNQAYAPTAHSCLFSTQTPWSPCVAIHRAYDGVNFRILKKLQREQNFPNDLNVPIQFLSTWAKYIWTHLPNQQPKASKASTQAISWNNEQPIYYRREREAYRRDSSDRRIWGTTGRFTRPCRCRRAQRWTDGNYGRSKAIAQTRWIPSRLSGSVQQKKSFAKFHLPKYQKWLKWLSCFGNLQPHCHYVPTAYSCLFSTQTPWSPCVARHRALRRRKLSHSQKTSTRTATPTRFRCAHPFSKIRLASSRNTN